MASITFANKINGSTYKIAYEIIEDRYVLNGAGYYCIYKVHQYSVFNLHCNSTDVMKKEAMI
jgi:hypothetical protein